MKRRIFTLVAAMALALGAGLGCSDSPKSGHEGMKDHGAMGMEMHVGHGKVVEIRADGMLVLDHQAIPGVMEAMTMPFKLKSSDVGKGVKAGDQVEFTLIPENKWFVISKITKK